MTNNENAPNTGAEDLRMTFFDNSIISSMKSGKIYMPNFLKELDEDFFEPLFPNISKPNRINIMLAKTIQMVSIKRICFVELDEKGKLVNHFCILFMNTGSGKDRSQKEFDEHIFAPIKEYLEQVKQKYKEGKYKLIEQEAEQLFKPNKETEKRNYIKTEKAKVRNIISEINLATPEGLYADTKAMNELKEGSLMLQVSELGLMLQNRTNENQSFITTLYQGYDNIVETKSIKGENVERKIIAVPINAILCSDPSMFKNELKHIFMTLMQTGLARRTFLTFQATTHKFIEENPEIAYQTKITAYKKAKIISLKFFEIFKTIPVNANYRLTEIAYKNVFHPYKNYSDREYNRLQDLQSLKSNAPLLQAETSSRELKVLKLACVFAALNHPTILEINETDLMQAISVVEYLGNDFEKYLKYKPIVNDNYDRLLDFFVENLGKPFTKTELVSKSKLFGFKREAFRKSFESDINLLMDIAKGQGYILIPEKINNNSGEQFTLTKAPAGEADEDLAELVNI